MEKITKVCKKNLKIPKFVIDYLNGKEKDLVKWEIDKNKNLIKFSCVNYNDYPNIRTDNSYIENNNIVLYRRLYKQGATVFPVIVYNYMNFEKNHKMKWIINDKNEVLVDKIEITRLIDLSGIVKGEDDNV